MRLARSDSLKIRTFLIICLGALTLAAVFYVLGFATSEGKQNRVYRNQLTLMRNVAGSLSDFRNIQKSAELDQRNLGLRGCISDEGVCVSGEIQSFHLYNQQNQVIAGAPESAVDYRASGERGCEGAEGKVCPFFSAMTIFKPICADQQKSCARASEIYVDFKLLAHVKEAFGTTFEAYPAPLAQGTSVGNPEQGQFGKFAKRHVLSRFQKTCPEKSHLVWFDGLESECVCELGFKLSLTTGLCEGELAKGTRLAPDLTEPCAWQSEDGQYKACVNEYLGKVNFSDCSVLAANELQERKMTCEKFSGFCCN